MGGKGNSKRRNLEKLTDGNSKGEGKVEKEEKSRGRGKRIQREEI